MRGRLLSTRYRLTEPIGAGGMGEVWRARDEALGRDVAVKVFQPPREGGTAFGEAGTGGYDSRSELLARFRQEARAAAALDSPNIVAVHDFDTDQELPYLVMALVAGQSLEQLLRAEGRLPLDRSLRWAEQICRALAAAHGAGVIHRDIKPGNVMVTDDDTVKVLDFGIAKFLDTDDAADKLTRTGQMPFGTVLYMAPEQFTQQASDGRLDLYALGCVLYELLVGRPPYTGPAAGIMYNHLHSTPLRPSAARPELTPAVDRLVLDLMARDPADRPADAEAAGERVRELRATLSRVTPTGPPDTEPPDTEPPNAEPPNAEAGRASGGPADDVARGGRSPASGTLPAPESEPRDAAELTPAAEPRDAVPTALPRTPNAQLDRHRRLRAGRKSWLKAAAVVAVPIALVAALNHNPFGGGSGAGPDLVITASGTDADRLSEVIRASGDPGPRGLRVERTPEEGYEDWDELVEGHPEVIAHFGEGPSSPGAPVVTVHAHESELIDDHAHSTVANRAVVARRLLAHLRERYDLGSLLHLGDTGGSGLLSRALFLQARAADTDVRFLAAGGDRDEEPDRAEVRRVIKSHAPEVAVLPNSDGDDPPPYTAAKLREDGFRGVILLEYPVDEYELAKTGVGTGAQEAEGVLRVRQFADPQADHNCELGRELCEVATGFTDPNTSSLEAFDAMLAVARALENVNSQMSVERAREAFEDGLITKEQGLLGPLGIAATEEQAIEHTTESEYGRLRPFWLDRSTDGRWQEQLKL